MAIVPADGSLRSSGTRTEPHHTGASTRWQRWTATEPTDGVVAEPVATAGDPPITVSVVVSAPATRTASPGRRRDLTSRPAPERGRRARPRATPRGSPT